MYNTLVCKRICVSDSLLLFKLKCDAQHKKAHIPHIGSTCTCNILYIYFFVCLVCIFVWHALSAQNDRLYFLTFAHTHTQTHHHHLSAIVCSSATWSEQQRTGCLIETSAYRMGLLAIYLHANANMYNINTHICPTMLTRLLIMLTRETIPAQLWGDSMIGFPQKTCGTQTGNIYICAKN